MKAAILFAFAFLLVACTPKPQRPVDNLSYQFIPPVRTLVAQKTNVITISKLEAGEWVIIAGSGGVLLPSQELGPGNRCFVLGVKGPTTAEFTVKSDFMDSNKWAFLGATSDQSHFGFDDNMKAQQRITLEDGNCKGGIDVWTNH